MSTFLARSVVTQVGLVEARPPDWFSAEEKPSRASRRQVEVASPSPLASEFRDRK